jgi:hypothetical protein
MRRVQFSPHFSEWPVRRGKRRAALQKKIAAVVKLSSVMGYYESPGWVEKQQCVFGRRYSFYL